MTQKMELIHKHRYIHSHAEIYEKIKITPGEEIDFLSKSWI